MRRAILKWEDGRTTNEKVSKIPDGPNTIQFVSTKGGIHWFRFSHNNEDGVSVLVEVTDD